MSKMKEINNTMKRLRKNVRNCRGLIKESLRQQDVESFEFWTERLNQHLTELQALLTLTNGYRKGPNGNLEATNN